MNYTPKVRQKTFGVFLWKKRKKNSKYEKIQVVELYQQSYRLSGFDKQPSRELSVEIKEQVVRF